MRDDKHIAIKLRKRGKSYSKISKELGVPKSTLSDWFSDIDWSKSIKADLTKKANYIARKRLRAYNKKQKIFWEAWREQARQQARDNFSKLKSNPLFIAGLMLYWAEGDNKPENPFRLSNTDPRMIKLYVKFLIESLNVLKENIRLGLILYPDLIENRCIDFWSKNTTIHKSQFHKTQFIQGRHPTKRLSYGICMVTCGNRQLKEKALLWIDLLSKNL